MTSQNSRLYLLTSLASSLVAASLPLTAGSAHADNDRSAIRIDNLQARETLRMMRVEAHQQRIQQRIESRSERANVSHHLALPNVSGVLHERHQGRTTRLEHADNLRLQRHSNPVTRNTAVLFPGQVSTFHTQRPLGTGSTFINDAGKSRQLTRGLSLDLSSTNENITVGEGLFDGTITITVGGADKTIAAGSKVTAAEYAALTQKLSTGTQTLLLGTNGAADGGSLNLNSVSDGGSTIRASGLVVPANVTVTGDFARSADGLRVTKDVVNFGSIVATSSDEKTNTAIISARDVDNGLGASISSQSSATNPTLNLAVRADRDLNNDGSITSAGSLEISAGRLINNTGLLSATAGDITFSTPDNTILSINSSGGTVSALNGAINIRGADYTGNSDSNVFGGNFYSRDLNINAGQATANLKVGEVTGKVNSTGLAAHVSTDTDTLVIGTQCLTGDPTYYNTGDIVLGGDISVGEDLAIIAGGDITTNQTTLNISTTDLLGLAHNIYIVAGANITAGAGPTPNPLPGQPFGSPTGNATSPVTISGGDVDGGSIDLTGATGGVSISAIATNAGSAGGNVVIAAFNGGGTGGQVSLPTNSSVNSSGAGSGNNGNITVVAGSQTGTGIQLGAINAHDGSGINANTGVVSIVNAQPTSSDGLPITFGTNGSITSGNSITGSSTLTGGNTILGQIDAREARISAGNSLSVSQITASSTSLTALGPISLTGNLDAIQSLIVVSSKGISTGSITIDTSNLVSGPAGNIVMAAGATFTETATGVTITGASSFASELDLNNVTSIDSRSTTSSGGSLTLLAFENGGGGHVAYSGAAVSTAGGGTGGSVTIIGGANSGNSVAFNAALTTSSSVAGAGAVTLLSATPQSAGPISKTTGLYSGTFADESALTGGAIQALDISTNANIVVKTNGDLQTQNLNSNIGGGQANAGNINLVSGVASDFSVSNISANGSGTGNGGSVNISAGSGASFGLGNISANSGSTGVGGTAGNIFISANRSTALTFPSSVTAQGLGTSGSGGFVSLQNTGSGGISLNSSAVNFHGNGNSGSVIVNAGTGAITNLGGINFNAQAGSAGFSDGSISLSGSTITVTGGNLILDASGHTNGFIQVATSTGNVSVGGVFSALSSDIVDLQLNNHSLTVGGAIAGSITVTAGNLINVAGTLSSKPTGTNAGGGDIFLTSGDQVSVNNIVADGDGSGTGGTVDITSGASGMTINTISSNSTGTRGTVHLTANDGDIEIFSGVTSDVLTVALNGTTGGTATIGSSNVLRLGASGTGELVFSNGNNALSIASPGISGTMNVSLTTNSPAGITNDNSINITGTVSMFTSKLTNTGSISADSILVQSVGDLTIDGGAGSPGTMTGTVPSAGSPGNPSSPAAIQFITGTGANLNLQNKITFTGDVLLSNTGGTTTSANNSLFTGTNNISLDTLFYNQTGNGTIVANAFIFSGISIINTSGDVTLLSDAVFTGRDLVIAASGNVNLGNFSINTSSNSGNGGDVAIIAGFTITPALAGGQQFSQGDFFVDTPSGSGVGNITITGGGNINTSATGASGDAGSVLVVARGSIDLKDITATSNAGSGSAVTIIGQGVTTGSIDSRGATGDGAVLIDSSTPVPANSTPVEFNAGAIVDGSFVPSFANRGDISVASISADQASISLNTAAHATTVSGTLSAHAISLSSGTITFTNTDTLAALTDASGNGGSVGVFVDSSVIVNGPTFKVQANGTGTGDGGTINYYNKSAFVISDSGDVQFAASAPGAGGSLFVTSESDITVGSNGIVLLGSNGNGSNIQLEASPFSAPGNLIITDTNFLAAADAHGAQGDGGSIYLGGRTITSPNSFSSPLQLSANGVGTGNGGSITYNVLNDLTPLYIGAPSKQPKSGNFLAISAESGINGGDGGDVQVVTGGSLYVDTSAMTIAPRSSVGNWDGSNINLQAGFTVAPKDGSLRILGDISTSGVNNGDAGFLNLTSNSKKAFEIGTSKLPKNGIQGTISANYIANSAFVSITNNGGSIAFDRSDALNTNYAIIDVNGKGTITAGKGVTVTVARLELVSENGNIGKKPLMVDSSELTLNSSGASINVMDVHSGNVTLQNAHAAGDFTLNTANGLRVTQDIDTDAGDISLTTNNNAIEIETQTITANNGSLTLAALSTTNGSIDIAGGSVIETQGKGGQVVIAIGAPPKKGVGPNTLAGFTVTPTGKGNAYFGLDTSNIISGGTVDVLATNKNVVFSNLTTTGGQITIGDATTIEADPPSKIMTAPITATLNLLPQDNVASTLSLPVASTPEVALGHPQIETNNVNMLTAIIGTIGGFMETSAAGQTNGAILNGGIAVQDGTAGMGSPLTVNARVVANSSDLTGSELSENILFAPTSDVSIETGYGALTVSAGSVVIMAKTRHGVAVYDLHDHGRNSVVVHTAGKRISLSPGRHLTIDSRVTHNFASVNALELVQHRGLEQTKLQNGWNVFASEFSLPSACYAVKPLSELMNSTDANGLKLAKKIIKTTAVLMMLNPDRGDFVQHFNPSVTAMQTR